MTTANQILQRIGMARFGELTEAERRTLEAAVTGDVAKCGSLLQNENDLTKAEEWGAERTIRAPLIRWMCTDLEALPLVNSKGISISGAKFEGEINLVGVSIKFSLTMLDCAFPDGINVQDASCQNLNLAGSLCRHIAGDRLTVNGSLFLRFGFQSKRPVILTGSYINADLDCAGGYFENASADGVQPTHQDLERVVLRLDGANIGGKVFLAKGFKADGIVSLVGTTIKGYFDCSDAIIKFGINMRDAQTRTINLARTRCPYFVADRIEVKGSVFLRNGFKSTGSVVLLSSHITGDLDCNAGFFGKLSDDAHVQLRTDAENIFGKNLPLDALTFNGSSIGGYVFLGEGFQARGIVRGNGVTIGTNLHCDGGHFYNPGNLALSCQFSKIGGAALFRGATEGEGRFQTDGIVNLFGTSIAGSISFAGSRFLASAKSGVNLQNMAIGGTLRWKEVETKANTELNLSHTKVGQLDDDETSWPATGKLRLDGFYYGAIQGVPVSSDQRKSWLKSHLELLQRQSKDDFSLQPYRQLAETLRRSAYEDHARQVLVDMHKARRKQGGLSSWGRIWSWILQYTIGFGYRSHWAFGWSFLFVVLGTLFFHLGYENGLLVPTKSGADSPTTFSSLGYSLDTFLPIINLHQEEYWIPTHGWLRRYYWLHIGTGWALITLGVAGFTGLIRKE